VWTYVSRGASAVEGRAGDHLEFVLVAPESSVRAAHLVTMTAWYHANPDLSHRLGLGDTLPGGEPWLDDSLCDHDLISRPYPFGPEFEVFEDDELHVHFFWILPITAAERAFKIEQGLEALEARFEEVGLEYWRPDRASVI
jgi:suppressor of fused protein SUFU